MTAGLYLHIPFCSSVCPYCDFAVLIAGDERRDAFVDALEVETGMAAAAGWRFDTVYLGGGTPSSLTPERLAAVVAALRRRLSISDDAWWSLEANPEDVDLRRAAEWRELGFATVSLGVQSFDDRVLSFLGRRHQGDQAVRAVDSLKAAGFHTVAADLIFAVPGQTPDGWRRQLETAVALELDHLSCYQLTLHEGTVFGRRRDRGALRETPESAQAELFLLTHRLLADAGLPAYEVSNFAAGPHHRSRHNQKYWRHRPYLGLGPSAHSFAGRRRWWNQRKLRLWQRALQSGDSPVAGEERLGDEELLLERVMLGLRTADGVDVESVREEFGIDLVARNQALVARLAEEGRLELDGRDLRLTTLGLLVADAIAASLEL